MERKHPLKRAGTYRKFGSAGSTYPGVLCPTVTPALLKTFPLLRAKPGWLRTLTTSALTIKYLCSPKLVFFPTPRFHTPNPGVVQLLRPRLDITPTPVTTNLAAAFWATYPIIGPPLGPPHGVP